MGGIFIKRIIFIFIFSGLFCYIGWNIFYPIFQSNSIIIDYGFRDFDICIEQPLLWHYIKIAFIISYIGSSLFISNSTYSIIFNFHKNMSSKKSKIKSHNNSLKKINLSFPTFIEKQSSKLNLLIGSNEKSENIIISEKSLYQNILITGTIGTGKTSSAMYPFTKQLIEYKSDDFDSKIGMLILDVKGNYYKKVQEFVEKENRISDLIVLELGGFYKYNPLHKPNLKANVLANRLKTILLLFSPNNTESFWIDKAEQVLTECIKLCRLYNNYYVTFEEIHRLVTIDDYYLGKIKFLRELFISNKLNEEDVYNLLSALNFFEKEYSNLDFRTKSILKSEITRITNIFISDYKVHNTFSPNEEELNFFGFEDVIETGKIVVLNMNISEYQDLSKIIATYLKLDFQTEALIRLSRSNMENQRPIAFISDEYHEYCTASDANFFAQSRESKCINIVATQSYSSLLNTINNESTVKVIIQNLVNKLWFRTDDIFTIESAQKQIGKEDKEKISKSISENAQSTIYSYFSNSLNSKDSNISESLNTYLQYDFIYDTNFFTQKLENFTCLSFLSDGNKILEPQKIKLFPYFKKFGS